MVNAAGLAAVGYVSSLDEAALDQQRAAVTEHARTGGFVLAQIVTDRFDGFTISQVLDVARVHDARLVIVPGATMLATARAWLAHELEPAGAVCVVIDDLATSGVEPETGATASRVTDTLQRCTPRYVTRTDAP